MTETLDRTVLPRVTPAELPRLALAMARSGLALMLYGSPGIGKTALLQALGRDPDLVDWSNRQSGCALAELPVVTLSAPELNVEDLLGVPTLEAQVRHRPDGSPVTQTVTRWAIPAAFDPLRPFILFIDEPNRCDPTVRNALFQLITGRTTSSGFLLPPGSLACMAGNRAEDRAGVRSLDTAFSNRCGHFELEVSSGAWLDWAAGQTGFSPWVRAFIERHPTHLCRFDPLHPAPQQPTPRTWAALGRALAGQEHTPFGEALAQGLVGTEASQLFRAFCRQGWIVPSVADLLERPGQVRIPAPGQLDEAYLFAVAVSDYLSLPQPAPEDAADPLGRAVGVALGRLVDQGFEEVAMMALRRCHRHQGRGRSGGPNLRMLAALRVLAAHPRFGAFVAQVQALAHEA